MKDPFIKSVIILPCMAILLFACGSGQSQFTYTGNPPVEGPDLSRPAEPDLEESVALTASEQVLTTVCQTISACFPDGASVSDCFASGHRTVMVGYALGAAKGVEFSSFDDLLIAERRQDITPDTHALKTCLKEIQNLSCPDSRIQGAFQPTWDDPYSNQTDLLSGTSCDAVYFADRSVVPNPTVSAAPVEI